LASHPLPAIAWQMYFDGPIASRPLALADGVVVCVGEGDNWVARRIPLEPGGPAWRREMVGIPCAPMTRTGHVLVLPLQGGTLVALDLRSGEPLWPAFQTLEGELSGLLTARRSRIYVGLRGERESWIAALEVGRAEPLWQVADPAASRTAVHHPNGLMIGGGNGMIALACLAPDTGQARWRSEEIHGALIQLWSPGDGSLELIGDSCGICRVDPETGEILDERDLGVEASDARLVSNLVLAVAAEPGENRLLALTSIGLEKLGESPMQVKRLIEADTAEALVEDGAGRTRFLGLPELEALPVGPEDYLPPCRFGSWARDAAYLVDTTGRILTAVDLAPRNPPPAWAVRENV
jgi:hypothetical protein